MICSFLLLSASSLSSRLFKVSHPILLESARPVLMILRRSWVLTVPIGLRRLPFAVAVSVANPSRSLEPETNTQEFMLPVSQPTPSHNPF